MSTFQETTELERRGTLIIGVDRIFARRLYFRVPIAEFEAITGEPPYVEKLVAFAFAISSVGTLLISVALIVAETGWWSLLLSPAFVVAWWLFFIRSSLGRSSMAPAHLLLLGSGFVFLFAGSEQHTLSMAAVSYTAALWFGRLVYASTSLFMRNLIMRNERAINWLRNGFEARDAQRAA